MAVRPVWRWAPRSGSSWLVSAVSGGSRARAAAQAPKTLTPLATYSLAAPHVLSEVLVYSVQGVAGGPEATPPPETGPFSPSVFSRPIAQYRAYALRSSADGGQLPQLQAALAADDRAAAKTAWRAAFADYLRLGAVYLDGETALEPSGQAQPARSTAPRAACRGAPPARSSAVCTGSNTGSGVRARRARCSASPRRSAPTCAGCAGCCRVPDHAAGIRHPGATRSSRTPSAISSAAATCPGAAKACSRPTPGWKRPKRSISTLRPLLGGQRARDPGRRHRTESRRARRCATIAAAHGGACRATLSSPSTRPSCSTARSAGRSRRSPRSRACSRPKPPGDAADPQRGLPHRADRPMKPLDRRTFLTRSGAAARRRRLGGVGALARAGTTRRDAALDGAPAVGGGGMERLPGAAGAARAVSTAPTRPGSSRPLRPRRRSSRWTRSRPTATTSCKEALQGAQPARARTRRSAGRIALLEADAPPADSGILGPVNDPDALTVTIAFGASLFDGRYGLAAQRPRELVQMPTFPVDDLDPAQSHGDCCCRSAPTSATPSCTRCASCCARCAARCSCAGRSTASRAPRAGRPRTTAPATCSPSATAPPTRPRRRGADGRAGVGRRAASPRGPPAAPTRWCASSASTSSSGTASA